MRKGVTIDDLIRVMDDNHQWEKYGLYQDSSYEKKKRFVQHCLDNLERAGFIEHD